MKNVSNTTLWAIRLLAAAAAGISGYLFVLHMMGRTLPPGCGSGSGCAEVLTSRWSAAFGIPVSAPAAVLYAGVFFATCFVGEKYRETVRRTAWSALFLAAVIVACSVMWFIGVQAFILKAFCTWCMTDHAIGLLLAALILWKEPVVKPRLDTKEAISTAAKRTIALTAAGTLLAAGLVAAQFIAPYKGPSIIRLELGKNADTGPGPDRQIAVIDGHLQLIVADEPVLGSPDAKALVVVMFDYCCPHCRRTHEYLLRALDRYPGQLGIVCLPLPLDADCNSTVDETEARFEDSCELAQLALAVRQIDTAAFVEYDRWLFEPEMPRKLQEARTKAEQLVDAAALEAAMQDERIDAAITRHVEAYKASGAERIPLIMSPGIASIVGRPENEEQLFELFEQELGLTVGRQSKLPMESETPPNESRPAADNEHAMSDLLLWSRDLAVTHAPALPADGPNPNPLIYGEAVIVSLFLPGQLVALSRRDGAELWRTKLDDLGGSHVVGGDHQLYAKSSRTLFAVEPNTGEVVWSWTPYDTDGEWIYSSPFVIGNRVLIGDRKGVLHCLSADQGDTIWHVETPQAGQMNATACVFEDRAIIANNAAFAAAYELTAGRKIWETQLDGASISQIQRFGDLAVVQTSNSVYLLEVRDGSVSHQQSWRGEVRSTTVTPNMIVSLVGYSRSEESFDERSSIHAFDANDSYEILKDAQVMGDSRYDADTGHIYAPCHWGIGIIDPRSKRRVHYIDTLSQCRTPALPDTDGDVIYFLAQEIRRVEGQSKPRRVAVVKAIRHPKS